MLQGEPEVRKPPSKTSGKHHQIAFRRQEFSRAGPTNHWRRRNMLSYLPPNVTSYKNWIVNDTAVEISYSQPVPSYFSLIWNVREEVKIEVKLPSQMLLLPNEIANIRQCVKWVFTGLRTAHLELWTFNNSADIVSEKAARERYWEKNEMKSGIEYMTN